MPRAEYAGRRAQRQSRIRFVSLDARGDSERVARISLGAAELTRELGHRSRQVIGVGMSPPRGRRVPSERMLLHRGGFIRVSKSNSRPKFMVDRRLTLFALPRSLILESLIAGTVVVGDAVVHC